MFLNKLNTDFLKDIGYFKDHPSKMRRQVSLLVMINKAIGVPT